MLVRVVETTWVLVGVVKVVDTMLVLDLVMAMVEQWDQELLATHNHQLVVLVMVGVLAVGLMWEELK